MTVSRQESATWGVILAVLAAVGFSAKAILIKLAYPYGVDAITLLALRMVIALPFFGAVALRGGRMAGRAQLSAREHFTIASLGVLGYYVASFLDFLGLQYISAGLERLVLFLYPTLVVVLSWLLLGTRLRAQDGWAFACSYAGIGLAFAHDLGTAPQDSNPLLGGALVFASALAYAVYLIGNGQMVARVGAARFTALAMTWACLACILQFLLSHPISALRLPWQVYALAATMALLSTVLPSFLVSAAIRTIGSSRTALLGSVGPPATMAMGYWLLDEPVSTQQIMGAALVMAGVLLVGRQASSGGTKRK